LIYINFPNILLCYITYFAQEVESELAPNLSSAPKFNGFIWIFAHLFVPLQP